MSAGTLPSAEPGTAVNFFPFRLQLAPILPITQDQFFDFCQLNTDKRFERSAEGELIVMPPSGGESSMQNLSVAAQLYNWSVHGGKGKVTDSSGGYVLPNGATRAPDAAWISPEQLAGITPEQMKKFLPVCPFFLAEVMSPSDNLEYLREKMEEYRANGCKLGWLIIPEMRHVHVYRPGQPVQVLDHPHTVSADPELPGFTLDLSTVWQA